MIDGFDEAVVRHPSGREPQPPAPGTGRRGRWLVVGAIVAAVGLLTAVFGFGLSRDPTLVRSVLVGHPAPAFTLPSLGGPGPVRLSDFRGQVLVVNFWASWCGDCLVEHGSLAAAWERYRDQGMVLLGVAFDDRPADSLAFAKRLRMDWPLAADPGERTALDYGVYGVPETFVIDRVGRIRFKQVGPVSYGVLTDRISALLAGGPR